MKIDWMELKQQSKKYIGHNVIVLLCGVLALVFLALAVVAIFSIKGSEGIAVKEAFDVSAYATRHGRKVNHIAQVYDHYLQGVFDVNNLLHTTLTLTLEVVAQALVDKLLFVIEQLIECSLRHA